MKRWRGKVFLADRSSDRASRSVFGQSPATIGNALSFSLRSTGSRGMRTVLGPFRKGAVTGNGRWLRPAWQRSRPPPCCHLGPGTGERARQSPQTRRRAATPIVNIVGDQRGPNHAQYGRSTCIGRSGFLPDRSPAGCIRRSSGPDGSQRDGARAVAGQRLQYRGADRGR